MPPSASRAMRSPRLFGPQSRSWSLCAIAACRPCETEPLPGSPPELLAFNDWSAGVSTAENLIHTSPFIADGDAKHAWRQVRDRLSRCGVLIGASAIEVRPYHPPTAINPWYGQARQRVYLSATLGSMDDLQRRIGGMPVERLVTRRPLPPASTGKRPGVDGTDVRRLRVPLPGAGRHRVHGGRRRVPGPISRARTRVSG
jgi:hypothetical protein